MRRERPFKGVLKRKAQRPVRGEFRTLAVSIYMPILDSSKLDTMTTYILFTALKEWDEIDELFIESFRTLWE